MKNLLFFLTFSLLCGNVLGQSPYQLHLGREAGWVGGSIAVTGGAYLLKSRTPAFTPAQISALDASRVPRFDRYSLHHYSVSAQHSSDLFLYGSMVIPAILLADRNIRRDAPEVVVVVGEVFLVNIALTTLTKELVHRTRPFAYNPDAPLAPKLESDARRSFFSGHTSTSAAMTFATAKIWTDYHPDSRWKPVVWDGGSGDSRYGGLFAHARRQALSFRCGQWISHRCGDGDFDSAVAPNIKSNRQKAKCQVLTNVLSPHGGVGGGLGARAKRQKH